MQTGVANNSPVVVIISANSEWRAVKKRFPDVEIYDTPYGECFNSMMGSTQLIFFHGGWGKISAAATSQYAVMRWRPKLLVNLGTCGGFEGRIETGTVILVERALVYDIIEQMGSGEDAIAHFTTDLDLSWLPEPYPHPVQRGLLISADRDILVEDIPVLIERYDAVAADWESGAIAWVAARNRLRCLILRGVSDLVGESGGEAYGNIEVFRERTQGVMDRLLDQLPAWLKTV